MAFENYDLLSLRTEVKLEFGISGAAKDSVVDRKINDGIQWIVRKRDGLWPWQLKDLVINVAAQGLGVSDVTKGSASVPWVSGTKPIDPTTTNNREIIAFNTTQTNLNDGFLITDFTADVSTIDAQFTGTTDAAISHSLVVGYYILPDDFQRMRSIYDVNRIAGRIIQRTSEELEEQRRHQNIVSGINMIYAVEKDPIAESDAAYSPRMFLVPYPYPGSLTTLRGKYVADPQVLSATSDIPLVPRIHRDVVFWVACWQLAVRLKETSQIGIYKELADEALGDMLRHYDFAVDDTDLADAFEQNIGPVAPPPGFPLFEVF